MTQAWLSLTDSLPPLIRICNFLSLFFSVSESKKETSAFLNLTSWSTLFHKLRGRLFSTSQLVKGSNPSPGKKARAARSSLDLPKSHFFVQRNASHFSRFHSTGFPTVGTLTRTGSGRELRTCRWGCLRQTTEPGNGDQVSPFRRGLRCIWRGENSLGWILSIVEVTTSSFQGL